jgi:two-component system OmpR family response regulator
MKSDARVLIVDDDPAVTEMLRRSLARHGFRIDTTTSASDALARAGDVHYDAAILDLVMPEQDGSELATALRAALPGLPVVLLTGFSNSPLIDALRGPSVSVFTKPVAVQEIVDFLRAEIT